MQNKGILNIIRNNSEIEGAITHRSGSDLSVEINKPYQNLYTSSHIPTFARPYRSFDGEYGDSRARELLSELYNLGSYIDENFTELQQSLTTYRHKVAELEHRGLSNDEFKEKRKVLRHSLKSVVIDNKQYQERLSSLRGQAKELERKANEVIDSFFVKNFPNTVPVSLRNQVIDILEGKQGLRTS